MDEHATERDHPIDAYVFVVVLAAVLGAVFWVFVGSNWAYLGILAGAFAAWGIISLAIFGREEADAAH